MKVALYHLLRSVNRYGKGRLLLVLRLNNSAQEFSLYIYILFYMISMLYIWYMLYVIYMLYVNPKGNQPWIFIGRTDAEAEAAILQPPDAKSWLVGKDPDAGKDWRREEKGTIEDEIVGWHHWLNGHEFEQTLGDCEGQRSLVCAVCVVTKGQIRLSDWTTKYILYKIYIHISLLVRFRMYSTSRQDPQCVSFFFLLNF